ncbi:MAG: hypothetical protein PHO29_08620 [Acetobacterium sp.]|nr:hypothetical protein [Acetobacterium sp.]
MSNKSKGSFTTLRTTSFNSRLRKLEKLVTATGMTDIDFENKFASVAAAVSESIPLMPSRPNMMKAWFKLETDIIMSLIFCD